MKSSFLYHFLLLMTLLVISALSNSYQVLDASTSSIAFQKIPHGMNLGECRLKVSTEALYLCKNQVFVFEGQNPSTKFSQLVSLAEGILDADISHGNIVTVNTTRLVYTLRGDTTPTAHVQISEETPLLVRINSRVAYSNVIVISKVENLYNNSNNSSIVSMDSVDEFVIHSFFFGALSHVYHLKFPVQELDFQLRSTSFIEATLFHDHIFGNDYLIVALENGWLMFFRSFFENPQLEIIKSIKISTENDIKQVVSSHNLLFVLLENSSTGKSTLEIYRMIPSDTFDLHKECSFSLEEQDETSLPSPQIKVAKIRNTFLLSVNFPSSHILAYTFQSPALGIFPLKCPEKAERINYSDALKKVKMGYSFDYISNRYGNGVRDQGFLLTLFSPNHDSSYFFPYCMSNFRLNEKGFCEFCSTGYNQGGFQTFCESCDSLIGTEKTLVKDYDPMTQTCQASCNNASLFGANCNETCQSYLTSEGAILPSDGSAAINSKGFCSFQCQTGFAEETYGLCLKKQQEEDNINDQCAQLTDCMNCTMTQSCNWCRGSCQSSMKKCPEDILAGTKGEIVQNYLDRAISCGTIQPCGPVSTENTAGQFTFASDTVYKNQVCKWNVESYFKGYKSISVSLQTQDSTIGAWDNPPNVFMKYCTTQLSLELCWLRFVSPEGPEINVRANNVEFYTWVEESMIGNANQFKLSYEISSVYLIFDTLFQIVGLLFRFAFICILFGCFISSYQRFIGHNRRRRLIRELEGIELFDSENDIIGPEINADELMENERIVSRAVFETDSNEYEQNECPICLVEFKAGEGLAKLCCKHTFHGKCFRDWVDSIQRHQDVKCPVCNRVLM